jgi:hypothetical protein
MSQFSSVQKSIPEEIQDLVGLSLSGFHFVYTTGHPLINFQVEQKSETIFISSLL